MLPVKLWGEEMVWKADVLGLCQNTSLVWLVLLVTVTLFSLLPQSPLSAWSKTPAVGVPVTSKIHTTCLGTVTFLVTTTSSPSGTAQHTGHLGTSSLKRMNFTGALCCKHELWGRKEKTILFCAAGCWQDFRLSYTRTWHNTSAWANCYCMRLFIKTFFLMGNGN